MPVRCTSFSCALYLHKMHNLSDCPHGVQPS